MASLPYISPELTVRQVASASPGCAEMLRPLPGAWRGDRWTLQQLGPFARELGDDERSLLHELSRLAGVPVRGRGEPSRSAKSPMPLIFTALLVGIVLGTSFGLMLLLRIATRGSYDAVTGAGVHVHGLAQLWGWMTLFIFAVAGHLLRQSTTRPAPRWLEEVAAGLIVAGLLTFFAGLSGGVRAAFPAIDILGSSLLLAAAILFGLSVAWMLSGAICYLIGMDGLRSKPSRPIYGIDPRDHILIRVAFFWLVCSLGMILAQQFCPPLPHAYSGAWRHGLTVGFITTIILGVGYRILPVFLRQPLASTRLMLVSAALIIVGNAGRVILELLTIGGWTWSYRLMGITGVLEFAALILFAISLAATALNKRRVYSADQPLAPATRVQEAVNARPEIQDRLQQLGVTMFDAAPFIAPSMTLGALAMASGMTPHELIERLESKSVADSQISKPLVFEEIS